MTAPITIAPFPFTDADARAVRRTHPLELFTRRESRVWMSALLALRARPSCARDRGPDDADPAAASSPRRERTAA